MFLAKGFVPIIFHQENKGGVEETPDQHIILVHSALGVKDDREGGIGGSKVIRRSYLRRSMPFHSRTTVSQKPLRKMREEEGSGILRMMSASSEAKACWTRGLSDIQ